MSTFPDGLYEYGGVPVGGARFTSPWATHWFVDGISGSDANAGKKPNEAKATVDAAVQLAGVGDIVYVRPNAYVVGTGMTRYTEQVTVDLAQSNLSIIGVSYPNNSEFGARLAWTSTAGFVLDSSAPALHLENLHFFAGTTAIGSLILRNNAATNTQRNDGCTMYGCNFKGGTTGNGVVIQGGQAQRIINCHFHHAGAGQLTIATPSVSGVNQHIRNCVFCDNSTSGTTVAETDINASGAHVYSLLIERCFFNHVVPTSTFYIYLGGTLCTGLIAGCFFDDADVSTTTDINLGGTNMRIVGCYDASSALVA